jgi:hypothetical protein
MDLPFVRSMGKTRQLSASFYQWRTKSIFIKTHYASFAAAQFFARAKDSAPYHRKGLEIVLRHALWGRMISPSVSSLVLSGPWRAVRSSRNRRFDSQSLQVIAWIFDLVENRIE